MPHNKCISKASPWAARNGEFLKEVYAGRSGSSVKPDSVCGAPAGYERVSSPVLGALIAASSKVRTAALMSVLTTAAPSGAARRDGGSPSDALPPLEAP